MACLSILARLISGALLKFLKKKKCNVYAIYLFMYLCGFSWLKAQAECRTLQIVTLIYKQNSFDSIYM